MKIAFFGDSIANGQDVNVIDKWTYLVSRKLEGVETCNLGVNGDTTRHLIHRLPEVYAFAPEVVIICVGWNDCNRWETDHGFPRVMRNCFGWNLVELYGKLRASGVRRIIPVTNYLSTVRDNQQIRLYNNELRENNDDTITTFDMEAVDFAPDLFLQDGKNVHLNERGHIRYAYKITPFIKDTICDLQQPVKV